MKNLFLDICENIGDAFIWLVDTADVWLLLLIGFIAGSVAYAVLAECTGCGV